MSGLEIVGVVLGAIPICVIALDAYIKGTEQRRRLKECRYDLISLRRVLTTHHSILENTCRSLLTGLVSDKTLEQLVKSPNSKGWGHRAIAKALEKKLGASFQPCLEALDDVYAELQTLRELFQTGPDGKVDWDNQPFLKRHLKWLSFSLQAEERERLIQRLRARTHDLQSLLQSTERVQVATAATKRKVSKGYDFKDIRYEAHRLYHLLLSSWSCACATHFVCLRLETREVPKLHTSQRFLVKLGFTGSGLWWYVAELESIPNDFISADQCSGISMSQECRTRKVQFAPDDSDRTTAQQNKGKNINKGSEPLLENLCDLTTRSGPINVLRHANGQRHRLIRKTIENDPGVWLVPLHVLVDKPKPGVPNFSREGPVFTYSGQISRYYRRKLALVLASSALQLHGTGWLSYRWGQDVVFSATSGSIQVECPFVSKLLPLCDRKYKTIYSADIPVDSFEVRRETLFALAMVLIQLCFHSPWVKLQEPEDIIRDVNDGERLSNRYTASRVSGKISGEEGVGYQEVVQYCIEWGDLEENRSLSEKEFHSNVCENVLAPLYEEMANFAQPVSH